MTGWKLARRVPLGAELALVLGAGVASFALVGAILVIADSDVLAAVLAGGCIAVAVAIARSWRAAGSTEAARSELADEQAALRRVATLVARRVAPAEVFEAIAREAGRLLGADVTQMGRYELGGTVTRVASWSRAGDPAPPETRYGIEGDSVVARVWRTGHAARMAGYDAATGAVASALRDAGVQASAGAPIVVGGRLWGVMVASSKGRHPLPADTESRIVAFTELAATAISDTEARAEVRSLADEQAALRRVATLVAQDAPPSDLFGAVTEEVGTLLAPDLAEMICYEDEHTYTAVAHWSAEGAPPDLGGRWPLEGGGLAKILAETAQAARIDDWTQVSGRIASGRLALCCSVGSPIVVEGELWGGLLIHSTGPKPLPRDAEARLTNFTELVATAIANAEARFEMRRLADEQAALRRVATLVARASSPAQVFAAVAEEVGLLLGVDDAKMCRYGDDGTAVVMAGWGHAPSPVPIGSELSLEGQSIPARVLQTGRAARIDAAAAVAAIGRDRGIRSAVGSPIVVDGRLWGVMVVASRQAAALPPDTESRVGQFTELVATAISNIEARADLAASRARIVAAIDEERGRVVRDLHDGAQQRLVHTVVTLKLARRLLGDGDTASALVAEALEHAESATVELRELAHGILPAILTRGGLRAGVDALASRMEIPVENGVAVGRLPAPVEATAYFVVAEALTNVAKHSRARSAAVCARVEGGALQVDVRDDGVGGARAGGSGLVGLADRLAVLDGRLRVESPADGGTLVAAAIPLDDEHELNGRAGRAL